MDDYCRTDLMNATQLASLDLKTCLEDAVFSPVDIVDTVLFNQVGDI